MYFTLPNAGSNPHSPPEPRAGSRYRRAPARQCPRYFTSASLIASGNSCTWVWPSRARMTACAFW